MQYNLYNIKLIFGQANQHNVLFMTSVENNIMLNVNNIYVKICDARFAFHLEFSTHVLKSTG